MKTLIFVMTLILVTHTYAEDSLLLIPDDGAGENLIVTNLRASEGKAPKEVINEDLELLRTGEFDLNTFAREHLQVEAQVRATVMALEAYGSLGVRTLNDYLEVGVDTSVLFVAAGTDGALIPSVGTYVKVRLTPHKAKTVYFKGRVYKAWNLADGRSSNKEFGVGYEFDRGQSTIELTVKEFSIEGEGSAYLPFIGFSMKIGGPRPKANGEPLFD
jgi:hypothetical protein